MPSENSISVIIPALNEERDLEITVVDTVIESLEEHFDEYEILIFDDGSTDRTGEIADRLRDQYDRISVVHHDEPKNLGGVFKEGVALAKMHYVALVNGKNDSTAEELGKIWALKGKADMIIPYTANQFERPRSRQIVSRLFTRLVNLAFGMRLTFHNHYVLHRLDLIRSIHIRTSSYAFQAEALAKLIRRGHSYVEVAHWDKFNEEVATKAFRPRNFLGVAKFFLWTFYDLYLTGDYRRRTSPAPQMQKV